MPTIQLELDDYIEAKRDIITEFPAELRKQWEELGYGPIQTFYQFNRNPNGKCTFHPAIQKISEHNASEIRKLGDGIDFTVRNAFARFDQDYVILANSQPTSMINFGSFDEDDTDAETEGPEIDIALLYHCMAFFRTTRPPAGCESGSDSSIQHSFRVLDTTFRTISISEATVQSSKLANLSVDLQSEILDTMRIHEAEDLVRQSLPHLIPHWLLTLLGRFERWFNELASSKNLRLLGCAEISTRKNVSKLVTIYRLRSEDLHSHVDIGASSIRQLANFHSTSHLPIEAKGRIMASLLTMYSEMHGNAFSSNRRKDDCTCHTWDSCSYCNTYQIRKFAIPLTTPKKSPKNPTSPSPYLLIFEDELTSIFKNLEIILRPLRFEQNRKTILRGPPGYDTGNAKIRTNISYLHMSELTSVAHDIVEVLEEPGRLSGADVKNEVREMVRNPPVMPMGALNGGIRREKVAEIVIILVVVLAWISMFFVGFVQACEIDRKLRLGLIIGKFSGHF